MHDDLLAVPAYLEEAPTRGMARWRLKRGSSHVGMPRLGTLALVGLVVLALAGTLIGFAVSGSPPKAATVPTPVSAPTAAQAAGDRAVLGATGEVTSAGDSVSLGMNSMHGLPTVPAVAAVVDPYRAALGRYQTALDGVAVDEAATPWRGTVLEHIDQVNSLISQLPDVPSAHLGAWIDNFYLQTAELESAVEALLSALGHPAAA
ncbi:MAG TPA: hypothetical protein VGG38_12170 [Acidimicrobiales bacterium]|jgi:hypothetical protein